MKKLSILRHAEAIDAEPLVNDFDRPVSPQGQKSLIILAEQLKTKVFLPELVLCSPARRARDSLDGLRALLPSFCEVVFEERLYSATKSHLIFQLSFLNDDYTEVLLIGHNPGLEQLLNWLLNEEYSVQAQSNLKTFPACNLVSLLLNISCWGDLKANSGQVESWIFPKEDG